jgi:hypothetical protein
MPLPPELCAIHLKNRRESASRPNLRPFPAPVLTRGFDVHETGRLHAPFGDESFGMARLILDQFDFALRGVRHCKNDTLSKALRWPSIQPHESAESGSAGSNELSGSETNIQACHHAISPIDRRRFGLFLEDSNPQL